MKLFRLFGIFCAGLALAGALAAQPPKPKRLLVIGEVKGFQHDSVSSAMATMWKLGKETGLWETYIKTDTQLITKKKLGGNGKNLDYFDAVFFYTTGELPLDDSQKADLISFVRDDGKGFIGSHSAPDTLYKWPAYGEMLGGYFDLHPWNTFDAPLIVEDRNFPAMKHMPPSLVINDEIYQAKDFSREKSRVLIRLDETKLDMTKKGIHRADKDFAVVWCHNYGKGRVFYNGLGHPNEVWDRPDFQKMMVESVKWVMKLIDGDATPRPRPAQ
jgi:type 1 glutamine amidotransferase